MVHKDVYILKIQKKISPTFFQYKEKKVHELIHEHEEGSTCGRSAEGQNHIEKKFLSSLFNRAFFPLYLMY